jgi:cytochrome c553
VGAAKLRDAATGFGWVATVVLASVVLASVVFAAGEAPAGAAACSGCHAGSARVVTPVPRIIGLDRAAIVKAMQEFRSGQRAATVMDRIAKGFTDEEIQAIAAWYAAQR